MLPEVPDSYYNSTYPKVSDNVIVLGPGDISGAISYALQRATITPIAVWNGAVRRIAASRAERWVLFLCNKRAEIGGEEQLILSDSSEVFVGWFEILCEPSVEFAFFYFLF